MDSEVRFRRIGLQVQISRLLVAPSQNGGSLVVVIFAWIGALPRYLSKYNTLWQRIAAEAGLGIIVVMIAPPTWLSFDASLRDIQLTSYSLLLEDLAELLTPAVNDNDPLHTDSLLLQFFSNGGAYAYEAISSSPSRCPWLRRCVGCVFDSCPVNILPHAVKLVLHNTLGAAGGAVAWRFYQLLQSLKGAR